MQKGIQQNRPQLWRTIFCPPQATHLLCEWSPVSSAAPPFINLPCSLSGYSYSSASENTKFRTQHVISLEQRRVNLFLPSNTKNILRLEEHSVTLHPSPSWGDCVSSHCAGCTLGTRVLNDSRSGGGGPDSTSINSQSTWPWTCCFPCVGLVCLSVRWGSSL